MAANLVSEVAEVLSPTVVSRIAATMGLDQSSTQKATNAAGPAILAALVSLVSKSQGAIKLNDLVAKQEPGVLSNLGKVIGESAPKAFIDNGANGLTSLLGGTTASAITNAVGHYAGIGGGNSKRIFGLVGSAVLGVLGQVQRDGGRDASGLAMLLVSQKDVIRATLPLGFSRYLDQAGISLADVTPSTTKFSPQTPYRSTPTIWPGLLVGLAVLVLGALLWNHLAGRQPQVAETPPPKIEVRQKADAPYASLLSKLHGIKVGDIDIGDLATSAVNDLTTSLSGINDKATAQTELSRIKRAFLEFDQLASLIDQLPPDARKTLVETFAAIKPDLNRLIISVLAIPSVGAVIKPTIDAIRSKLYALSTA